MGSQFLAFLFSQIVALPITSQFANTLWQSPNVSSQLIGGLVQGLVQLNSHPVGLVQMGAEKVIEAIVKKVNE